MEKATIEGYIGLTGTKSRILKRKKKKFREIIKPGVFNKSLREYGKPLMLFNHSYKRILAFPDDLELFEDEKGLRYIAKIDDIEIISKALNGELTGCSFKFSTIKNFKWGTYRATTIITDMCLLEISLLDKQPAYCGTTINVTYVPEELKEKIRDYEEVKYGC